jgi:hypothetical protein
MSEDSAVQGWIQTHHTQQLCSPSLHQLYAVTHQWVSRLLYDFLSLKNNVNEPSKSNSKKTVYLYVL